MILHLGSILINLDPERGLDLKELLLQTKILALFDQLRCALQMATLLTFIPSHLLNICTIKKLNSHMSRELSLIQHLPLGTC